MAWRRLTSTGGPACRVSLRLTFLNGQVFSWKQREPDVWTGVLAGMLLSFRNTADGAIEYCWHNCPRGSCGPVTPRPSRRAVAARPRAGTPSTAAATSGTTLAAADGADAVIRDYFQLDVDMENLARTWSAADKRFASIWESMGGMRVLRQPPEECLFSFLTSSNNHISRITQNLALLRKTYGRLVGEVGGEPYYEFPTTGRLAEATEEELRNLGLGYRAKYITESAAKIQEQGGLPWLLGLRTSDRKLVQSQLMNLPGVGPKVADCVAVFSLDQRGVVPVDTHVWSIACRELDASLAATKSLTPSVYDRVGDLFRARYGEYAGWAHSVLFGAELPVFRPLLPPGLVAEMDAFQAAEKARKAAARSAKQKRSEAKANTEEVAVESVGSKARGPTKAKTGRQRKGEGDKGSKAKPAQPAGKAKTVAPQSRDATAQRGSRSKRPREPRLKPSSVSMPTNKEQPRTFRRKTARKVASPSDVAMREERDDAAVPHVVEAEGIAKRRRRGGGALSRSKSQLSK